MPESIVNLLPNGSPVGEDAALTNNDAMGRQLVSQTTRRIPAPIVPYVAHFDNLHQECVAVGNNSIDEERPFHRLRDCDVCIAKENNFRVPHRRHHDSCPDNRSNKEKSQHLRMLFSKQINDEKERELTSKKRKEATPLGAATKMPPNVEEELFSNEDSMLSPGSTPQEVALFLEKRVAERIASAGEIQMDPPIENKMPPAMQALAEVIFEQVEGSHPNNNAAAYKNRFQAIFGRNNMVYTVPKITDNDHVVDPHFHSLAGSKLIYMDMEMAFPKQNLSCFRCKNDEEHDGRPLLCDLHRVKDSSSKSKHLLPIVDDTREIWCRPFQYDCGRCGKRFETNDGEFLASLPAFIRHQYSVDPRYYSAKTNQNQHSHPHLSISLSRMLEEEMRTPHSNENACQMFLNKIARRKHQSYVDRCEDYYSRPKIGGKYPGLQDVIRTYPPSDQDCRNLYKDAQDSSVLNPREGISVNKRNDVPTAANTKTSKGELLLPPPRPQNNIPPPAQPVPAIQQQPQQQVFRPPLMPHQQPATPALRLLPQPYLLPMIPMMVPYRFIPPLQQQPLQLLPKRPPNQVLNPCCQPNQQYWIHYWKTRTKKPGREPHSQICRERRKQLGW